MKYDKQIRTLIHKVKDECKDYLDYVESLNECAFSDRKLEYIIDIVKRIEEINKKRFKSIKKDIKVR